MRSGCVPSKKLNYDRGIEVAVLLQKRYCTTPVGHGKMGSWERRDNEGERGRGSISSIERIELMFHKSVRTDI